MFSHAVSRLTGFMFGGTCFLCRGRASRPGPDGLLCEACDADLPRLLSPACPRCALASPGAAVCGRCLADAPAYDATYAALAYVFPVDVLVHALKFGGELALAPLLGGLVAERARPAGRIDVIVPVPLSIARLRNRGYNQAMEIARCVGQALRAPIQPQLCERTRDTPAQTGLAWPERTRNLRSAFRCRTSLEGAVVGVVDDVMTTGATLAEIAKSLKGAGAARVINLVAARTFPPAEGPPAG
jgi:ComF family protein